MEKHGIKKFDHDNISNIIAEMELPNQVLSHISNYQTDIQILNALLGVRTDFAINFLALGLPKREAVWWSYLCIAQAESASQDAATQYVLRLVHEWVHKPNEAQRQIAKTYADRLEHATPASWSAMAVYWSGGSVAPTNQPSLEPEPFMCGQAVANAVILSSQMMESPNESEKKFLKKGLHIAMGGNGKIE